MRLTGMSRIWLTAGLGVYHCFGESRIIHLIVLMGISREACHFQGYGDEGVARA
jgi:hypothetical protein